MEWSDQGIVLGTRAHGEAGAILELMTREHGRHLGLLHGARSRRLGPVVQAGNTVAANWHARLDEQLGRYTVEPETVRSARLIASPLALYGLATLAHHLRLLPERDPHPALFDAAHNLLDGFDDPGEAPAASVRFELLLLSEMGYGLDLATCAATGDSVDLVYVSPRSGRAVSREAGEPYRDKLLRLPAFLRNTEPEPAKPNPEDVAAGFRLTGFFLEAHLYGPQGRTQPEERARLIARAMSD